MIALDIHKRLNAPNGPLDLAVQLELEAGDFACLYGKSGAGKTSLLRILAGLLTPERGRIEVAGEVWLDTQKGIKRPPQKRKVGLVFQDYALFPHLTVADNLRFALTKKQDAKIVAELIELMELGDLQSRKPARLSGGQQQRVALARALVQKPDLLLLDEPLSALDQAMRLKLQQYLLRVHREYQCTTILISHDIAEILRLADVLVALENGKVAQKAKPASVFGHREKVAPFQVIGEVLSMVPQADQVQLTLLIGQDLSEMPIAPSLAQSLKIGDRILVASENFKPIIKKIE